MASSSPESDAHTQQYRQLLDESLHVRKLVVDQSKTVWTRVVLTKGDGSEDVQVLASPHVCEVKSNSTRTRTVELADSEYWIGVKGCLDMQDGEIVLLAQHILTATYSSSGEFISEQARAVSGFNISTWKGGSAQEIEWRLPQGYAVRSLSGVVCPSGRLRPNGIRWAPIANAKRSWSAALRLKMVALLGSSVELLDKSKAWLFDLLVLTGAAVYVDIVLDGNSTYQFWKAGQKVNASLMVFSVLCSSAFSYVAFLSFYSTLTDEDGVELFGQMYQPICSCRGLAAQMMFLFGHIFQLHLGGLILISLRRSQTHPLLLQAKEAEALLEAALTSLVQCYSAVYYEWRGLAQMTLLLSVASSFASLGIALAGYDRKSAGLQEFPGTLDLEPRFGVLAALRACEVCSRITSASLFQRLTRPFGGAVLLVVDMVVLSILHKIRGPSQPSCTAFVRSVLISVLAWRNPVMEKANAASIPFAAYYLWRLTELCLMGAVLYMRVSLAELKMKLYDDLLTVGVFVASTVLFYTFMPWLRKRWATYVFEKHASHEDGKLVIQAKVGKPGWTTTNVMIEYLERELLPRAGGGPITRLQVRGDADGQHFVLALCRLLPSVTNLDLRDCNLTSTTARPLCEQMALMSLESLDLYENRSFGDNGVKEVARLLQTNATLNGIDLSEVGLTDVGAEALCEALTINKSLKELDTSFNPSLSQSAEEKLRACLARNTRETEEEEVKAEEGPEGP